MSEPGADDHAPQPPPPPSDPPAWGAPAHAPSFPTYVVPDHPRATAALVVGIISVAGAFLCVLPILASPVAWVLGAQARREIRQAPHQWSGEGKATAGMVLGIVGTVLLALGILAFVLVLAIAFSGSSVDSGTRV